MKNRYKVVTLICAMVAIGIIYIRGYKTKQYLSIIYDNQNEQITLTTSDGEMLSGWEKDGVNHFFVPTYIESNLIKKGNDYQVIINGDKSDCIPFDELCQISVARNDEILATYETYFHHSQNVYTMYLNLDNAKIDDICKEGKIRTSIKVMTPDGQINYWGENDEIGGHGNSTWMLDKKPYSLKLHEKESLCNMNAGKKWLLLANYSEGSKMACKLLYDLSGKIGMEYYIHSEWVDLYINGEYRGNYLLCERIEISEERLNITDLDAINKSLYQPLEEKLVGDDKLKGFATEQNPDDISGGYIIEKDLYLYQEYENCGFYTDDEMCFSVTEPTTASYEEVRYIRDFVQTIEDLIDTNDSEVLQYIDADSFIRRFVIEECCFNIDSFITSCYFYKKAGEDRLYAGPVWDYDISFGEYNGPYLQYDFSVLRGKELRKNSDILDWDMKLHRNVDYMKLMKEEYASIYPALKECLYEDIDAYADKIRTSVILDNIRWNYSEAGHYASFDNNVRYIKFFMRNRINMMNERYGADETLEADDLTEETHMVRCLYEGQLYEYPVKDGDFLKECDLPPFDNEKYSGWRYERDGHFYCELLPIFEDIILLPNERG